MILDMSAIPIPFKIRNLDYEALMRLRRVPSVKRCRPAFEIKTESPIEHEQHYQRKN
jgi:hypothetical protein